MKVIIAGDFCDRYRVAKKIEEKNYLILFSELAPILRNSDFSIVNFEFPIGDKNSAPIEKNGPCLCGQEGSIDAIKFAGFNVTTLANNHILDQGKVSCLNTIKKLNENSIYTVGAGKNLEEASKILYLEKNSERLAIINCCENEFSIASNTSTGANPLSPIKQYYKILEAKKNADFVIVIVHGGSEHCKLPSPRMKELYRFFIDSGANAVVNHHQHCYSGYEVYHNAPIFYGIGNLLFDNPHKRNSDWNEGFMISLDLSKMSKSKLELIPYNQCNDEPKVTILDGELKQEFLKKVNELNEIICDNDVLEKEYFLWVEQNSSWYKNIFVPYNTRIAKGLFKRGFLPSFIGRDKKNTILNFLKCESHFDRLMHIIDNKL